MLERLLGLLGLQRRTAGAALAPLPEAEASPGPQEVQAAMRDAVMACVVEQRRARRWSIFFRFAILAYLLVGVGVALVQGGFDDVEGEVAAVAGAPHVAVVDVTGVIEARGASSARVINGALRRAFAHESTRAVVVRVDSPGGSPVQSAMIHDEIRRLRAAHPSVPVYAVIEDMGASGGYFVAAAADRIYVNGSSLVGSIGVRMDGFGFTGTMRKLGVERRLITAGRDKGMLDPFSPENPEHRRAVQTILEAVHTEFIQSVRGARGDRLRAGADLFTGRFWAGQAAIDLGLADARGSVHSVSTDVVRLKRIVDFTDRETIVDRLGRRLGVAFGSALGFEASIGSPQLR